MLGEWSLGLQATLERRVGTYSCLWSPAQAWRDCAEWVLVGGWGASPRQAL